MNFKLLAAVAGVVAVGPSHARNADPQRLPEPIDVEMKSVTAGGNKTSASCDFTTR
jgi:hypothetical protein